MDPQAFKDDSEELSAHRKLAMMKKIMLEIYAWVDQKIEASEHYTKKEQDKLEVKKI